MQLRAGNVSVGANVVGVQQMSEQQNALIERLQKGRREDGSHGN
jgi:hypothetical protein